MTLWIITHPNLAKAAFWAIMTVLLALVIAGPLLADHWLQDRRKAARKREIDRAFWGIVAYLKRGEHAEEPT